MGQFLKKGAKGLAIGLAATALVALGIDASDHYDNMSESLVGRIFFPNEEGPCGYNMVLVPTDNGGFCLDMYEAAPGKECPTQEVGSQSETQKNINNKDCQAIAEAGLKPWLFISQSQAEVACAKAGKRLPTNSEWYQASLGTPDSADESGPNDCQINSNWPEQPGLTGSGPNCVSAFGAYDMIGNVWEWVKGEVREGKLDGFELPDSGFVTSVDSAGIPLATAARNGDENFNNDYFWIKKSDIRGMARGGYWSNGEEAGIYSVYMEIPLTYAGGGIGFRCAR